MKRITGLLLTIVALFAVTRVAQAQYQNCWTQSYTDVISTGGGGRGTQFCIQTTTETMCYVSDFIEVVDSSYSIACFDARETKHQQVEDQLRKLMILPAARWADAS